MPETEGQAARAPRRSPSAVTPTLSPWGAVRLPLPRPTLWEQMFPFLPLSCVFHGVDICQGRCQDPDRSIREPVIDLLRSLQTQLPAFS